MLYKHNIELNITLQEGGPGASDVIEMYGAMVCEDINQTAWNLCGCDENLQHDKFTDLALESWSVIHKRGEDFLVKAQFTVASQNTGFIQEVVDEYMDGFADFIADTLNGYYSRTGRRVALNRRPLNWEVQIEKLDQ